MLNVQNCQIVNFTYVILLLFSWTYLALQDLTMGKRFHFLFFISELFNFLPLFQLLLNDSFFMINLFFSESDLAKYHSYEDLETEGRSLENKYPNLVKLRSIGKSVEGRELYVFQVPSLAERENQTKTYLRGTKM